MKKIVILVSSLLVAASASASAFTTSQTYLKLDYGASFGKGCAPEGIQSTDKFTNTLSCEKHNWNFLDKKDYSFTTKNIQNNSVNSADENDYIKINSFSEPGKDCTPDNLLSRDKNGNYITCKNNKWAEKK